MKSTMIFWKINISSVIMQILVSQYFLKIKCN